MSIATGPRRGKGKIKPPRKHVPDTSMSDTWDSLSRAIREIHKNNASNLSFEENYRYAYNLVIHKQGDMLYKGVNGLIAENVDRLAREEVQPAFPTKVSEDPAHQSQESERLLQAMRAAWDDHTSSMSKLRDLLKYMDRVYAHSASVPVIWDSGMNIFLEHMIKPPIKGHIVDALLSQIRVERMGYAVNRSAIKSCVDVTLQLIDPRDGVSVYKRVVEPAILRESEIFFEAEGVKLVDTCDAPEFLTRVETRFNAEEARAHHYLSSQTANPLKHILEEKLLVPHLPAILNMPNSGLDNMVDFEKIDDIARLYRLFIMVPFGLPGLKKALKESTLRRGKDINDACNSIVEEEEQRVDSKGKGKARAPASQSGDLAAKWVQDVLALKDKMDLVWRKGLQSDREIETALNEAFEAFINLNPRAAEFISLFIDDNLKKGLKGKTDQEVDVILDKTIVAFRYLTEKDVFERYYKAHLAKRLLLGRSVSDDAERGMLSKLKIECGFQFTQKMEGMFTDLKVSTETMEAYRKHIAKTTAPEIDISVIVMTSTFWPSSQSPVTCTFPGIMIRACRSFENFYLTRHSGRRLTWQPALGNADIRVKFKAKTHDLNVSTISLVILLLFENVAEGEFLTYEEILKATALPETELKRNLQSLACAKYKILKKHPPSRDVRPDDSFSFNEDFSAPLQKLKIAVVSARVEGQEERQETNDRIDEERKHQIEACIVRIMKNRKLMSHNDLVNEVIKQLSSRFQPPPSAIKRRIEGLIEREYLERGEDKKSYKYLA